MKNEISRIIKQFSPGLIFFLVVFCSCSSAPKKPTEIFTERNTASNQLALANQTASHGHYEDALIIIENARRIAIGTDDPELRVRTLISRGNILFSLGQTREAVEDFENAASEAEAAGNGLLAALARVFLIRTSILTIAADSSASSSSAAASASASIEEYKDRINGEMPALRSDQLSTAAGYITLGLAEKELGRWEEAEAALRRALDVHEKNLNLEEAAYDWFLIASIRSMAGDYDAAINALQRAIGFDRRAENGYGLASSWQAMGEVYQKAGRAEEARAAFERSEEIFDAINLPRQKQQQ